MRTICRARYAVMAIAGVVASIAMTCGCFGEEPDASASPTPASALIMNTGAIVIALPKDVALKFTMERNLVASAADGLKALDEMVDQKKAEILMNPSISCHNNQLSTSGAEPTELQVETDTPPPGDMIFVNLILQYKGKKFVTALYLRSGEVRYLGAFDWTEKGKDFTCLAFVRIQTSNPMPAISDMFELSVSTDGTLSNVPGNYLPITLILRNKRKEDINVSTANGYCMMVFYSVGESGEKKAIYSNQGDLMEVPDENWAVVTVKAGQVSKFKSMIPLDLAKGVEKLAIAIVTTGRYSEPSYTICSKPFALSDLK